MEPHGFIRDRIDVKILILTVMTRVAYPVSAAQIYELCLQDDKVSYFDIMEAVPQLADSGHLTREGNLYTVTEKGRATCALVEDSLAFPVAERAKAAAERFNRRTCRDNMVRSQVTPRPGGDFAVVMGLDDEAGNLLTLELMAPTEEQARQMADAFHGHAEAFYQLLIDTLQSYVASDRQKREEARRAGSAFPAE